MGGLYRMQWQAEWPEPAGTRSQRSFNWPAAETSRPLRVPGAPQLQVQTETCLYVSGQPSLAGCRDLFGRGMKTIVNLRAERLAECAQGAFWQRASGLRCIPVREGRAPTFVQAEEFLRLLADGENWPVLVHSGAGGARAATMAALARYSFDGWGMERCLREARSWRAPRARRRWRPPVPLPQPCERFLRDWAEVHAAGSFRPRPARAWQGPRFQGLAPHQQEMMRLWERLPASLRRVPILVQEVLPREWDSHYAGYYLPGEIHLRADLWCAGTFYHEYAHVCWHEVLRAPARADWERFWLRNLVEMPRDYARKDAEEGYAECFALALLGTVPPGYRALRPNVRRRVLGYFPDDEWLAEPEPSPGDRRALAWRRVVFLCGM